MHLQRVKNCGIGFGDFTMFTLNMALHLYIQTPNIEDKISLLALMLTIIHSIIDGLHIFCIETEITQPEKSGNLYWNNNILITFTLTIIDLLIDRQPVHGIHIIVTQSIFTEAPSMEDRQAPFILIVISYSFNFGVSSKC